MEHNTNEIDLLAEALPQECLAIILSYLKLLELVNLCETSKFFATMLTSSQKWMTEINQFFGPAEAYNLRSYSRKLNWHMLAKRIRSITNWQKSLQFEAKISDEPKVQKSYPSDMPQACLDLAMAHETAEVPRRFLAVSNEYIVFSEEVESSSEIKAIVYQIQPGGFVLIKSIKACLAHYWHKEMNILVLLKRKGVVKLRMDDASQECTRIYGIPPPVRKSPKPIIKDVREVFIKGTMSSIVTIEASNVVVFVDLTKHEVINTISGAINSHWLHDTKVALLRKSSLCVIDMTEKHTFKNKRFLVSGIQHDTPILDFTSSNTGHELFVATFRDKALEIRVCLWPIGVFFDSHIRIPATVVPSLNMKYEGNVITINSRSQVKLSPGLS